MCGSGTIPVEAGLIASGQFPQGISESSLGFRTGRTMIRSFSRKVREKYNSRIKPISVMISGSDISVQAVRLARESVQNAGLAGEVRINS
jgi:putative N6-adenine-specific DNA methylase